eukprot:17867-Heterococcus_DN1.PRE.3
MLKSGANSGSSSSSSTSIKALSSNNIHKSGRIAHSVHQATGTQHQYYYYYYHMRMNTLASYTHLSYDQPLLCWYREQHALNVMFWLLLCCSLCISRFLHCVRAKNSYSIEHRLIDYVPTAFYGAVVVALCKSIALSCIKPLAHFYPAESYDSM